MSDQYNIYALYFKVDLVKRKLCTKRLERGGGGKGNTIRRRRERGEEEGNNGRGIGR
jgi:hypothetical protein